MGEGIEVAAAPAVTITAVPRNKAWNAAPVWDVPVEERFTPEQMRNLRRFMAGKAPIAPPLPRIRCRDCDALITDANRSSQRNRCKPCLHAQQAELHRKPEYRDRQNAKKRRHQQRYRGTTHYIVTDVLPGLRQLVDDGRACRDVPELRQWLAALEQLTEGGNP